MAGTWQSRPDRPAPVPLLHVRLGEQLELQKSEPTWRTGDRNAITLEHDVEALEEAALLLTVVKPA